MKSLTGVSPGTVMVTQRVDMDEWWPVYFLTGSNSYGAEVELSASDYERMSRVFKEFSQVQQELRELFEGSV